MKTITITQNLPEDGINLDKLKNEVCDQFTNAIIAHRIPIVYQNSSIEEAIIISNLDDNVVEQDVIDIVINHKPNGLFGVIHECESGCECNCGHLYRTLRRKLINYVIDNYSTMSMDELKEASEHFCTPAEIRDQFFTIDEQIILGDIFNQRAIRDREIRILRVTTILMNYLTYLETVEIVNDLTNMGDLVYKYSKFGIEGTSEGDPAGIFDYFESTVGTIFEENGFLEKQFTPRGNITISQLSEKIMAILRIVV